MGFAGRNFYPAKWEALVASAGTDGKVPKDKFIEETKKIEFPKRQGAAHGPWRDDTFTATDEEIHAPKYFEKGWDDFGEDLAACGAVSLSKFLTKDMYEKYAGEKTALGVTIDKCIKGGIDRAKIEKGGEKWNCGKVGVLFGDAESVTKFSELMDPIILGRHALPADFAGHPAPNLDPGQLLPFDEIDDSYVISTRIRTGRSIKGFALPPSISATQRKELEEIVVGALKGLTGELTGDYYPLAGSCTYPPKPNGIDKETEDGLIKDHFLFQAPDEPMLLSWRMERDWPQARGIYHNVDQTALVWVNEEDHLRIISMERGYNIRGVFDRFVKLVHAVE